MDCDDLYEDLDYFDVEGLDEDSEYFNCENPYEDEQNLMNYGMGASSNTTGTRRKQKEKDERSRKNYGMGARSNTSGIRRKQKIKDERSRKNYGMGARSNTSGTRRKQKIKDHRHDVKSGMGANGSTAYTGPKQEIKGTFEAEICYGTEADLHQRRLECKKNPGHKNFIPVEKFTVNDLPVKYHDESIVKLIQALAEITVRIIIRPTSSQKPDTAEHSDEGGGLGTGSGWVWRVTICSQRNRRRKGCPCHICNKRFIKARQWAVIDIYTATHLVTDETVGKNATCYFFYDGADTKISDVPKISKATRVMTIPDADTCRMTYVTHDMNLAKKLYVAWRLYRDLHTSVGENYNTVDENYEPKSEQDSVANDDDQNLTIIVSHPHGCNKQISIGYYTEREEMNYNDIYTRYTYTTPTCPGSSGAPVYVLGRWWWWGCDHPHSANSHDNKELNISGIAMY